MKLGVYFALFAGLAGLPAAAFPEPDAGQRLLDHCGMGLLTLPDTALEFEPRVIPKYGSGWTSEAPTILGLFTTKDGTIGPLIEGHSLRPELLKDLRRHAKRGQKLEQIEFDSLPHPLKQELLVSTSARTPDGFVMDRKIRGLYLRDKIKVRFRQPTEIFGKLYPANQDLEFDLKEVLGSPQIEIGGPEAGKDLSFYEFHLRGNPTTAGRFLDGAWDFLEAAGISKDKAHAHVVGPTGRRDPIHVGPGPARPVRVDPVDFVQRQEHYRRVALVSEMVSVVLKGFGIAEVQNPSGQGTDVGSLSPGKLISLYYALKTYYESGTSPPPDAFKSAWVGFHFPSKYDDEVFGYQFRTVDKSRRDVFRKLLDGAQSSLAMGTHLIPKEDLEAWKQTRPGFRDWSDYMGTMWYTYRPVSPIASQKAIDRLQAASHGHQEVWMLNYDWSTDPILWNKPELQEQIKKAQLESLERVENGANAVFETRSFLKNSGLFDFLLKSVTE